MVSPSDTATPASTGDEDSHGGFPMALADRCVKCGLCLPHCPTYQLSGLEGESPRGRIALMQGLAGGRLKAEGALLEHLANCVGCRACEAVCPASVPYGELLDAASGLLPDRGPRLLESLARHPRAAGWAMKGLAGLRSVGLFSSIGTVGQGGWLTRSLRRMPLPRPAMPMRRSFAAEQTPRGRVSLFTGCVSRAMDQATEITVARLLARLGYVVDVPHDQVCCGALDQHAGRAESAQKLARENCRAFGANDTVVLSTATGCTATLLDYGRLAEQDGASFRARVRDVTDFLLEAWDPEAHAPTPIRASAAVHLPCTARHVTGSAAATETLLARIPGLDLHRLDPGYGCCGAAGHHFLSRGSQADALLEPLLKQIDALKPDFVVTTNIGCALHLAGGLAGDDNPPRVLHAAELVARALSVTDEAGGVPRPLL